MTRSERIDPDRGLPAAVPGADAQPPDSTRTDGLPRHRRQLRPWAAAVVGALVLPLVITAALTWTSTATDLFVRKATDARVVSAADLEQAYGMRVDLVAVTADGGLVDVRFTILDRDKAGRFLHADAGLPQLLLPDAGAVLRAPQRRAHKLKLVNGGSYFLLYPNSSGLVQEGVPVSVVIDELRLAPIAAQS